MKRLLLAGLMALFAFNFSPSPNHKPQPASPYQAVVERTLLSVGHVKGIVPETAIMEGDEEGFSWWRTQQSKYGCSAFSIAPRKFLTAAHCVGVQMTLDGKPAVPIQVDTKRDLAVLLVDDVRPSLTIRVRPLERMEKVIGLGYGYSFDYPTVTMHYVLMLHYTPEPKEIYPGVWVSNGFIGGMSGGPVIDLEGQVVMVVQRASTQVGYGVDAETITAFLEGKTS